MAVAYPELLAFRRTLAGVKWKIEESISVIDEFETTGRLRVFAEFEGDKEFQILDEYDKLLKYLARTLKEVL
jgi:hypothetical protein